MVFSILSYFTISKSHFINYTIPFYNTPNIPKLYFFPILFKYSFFNLFFYYFSFSLPLPLFLPQPLALASTSSKPIPSKITTKNHSNQTSTKNPLATPAKSQQKITKNLKIHTKITTKNHHLPPQQNHNKKSILETRSQPKPLPLAIGHNRGKKMRTHTHRT